MTERTRTGTQRLGRPRRRLLLAIGLAICSTLFSGFLCPVDHIAVADEGGGPSFERDIRPIFREFCFDCHGATEQLEARLDLRLVRFLTAGGDSGPAIVPGDPAASYLIGRLRSGEMPPGEAKVPDAAIDLLERWIAAGAPTLRPEPESIGPGVPISLEERSYWAYQPIQRPQIGPLSADERLRSPIDWLLRQAMPPGLTFSPDADRPTLIKRVFFDLIGLPPTEDELRRYVALPEDTWYQTLIDDQLDSPHYGERWARHWLDVAGYADSEGSTVNDADRPWVWKYRDYLIRAFNADKPFDRLITEQLAGDELAGVPEGEWTAEQIDLLTATGFLRLAADGTGSGDNSPEARNKVIADTLKIFGNSLLGMSLNCAQCHDHRYDPISQRDYYAIRSVFEPAFDWQQWQTPEQRRVSLYTAADRELAAQIEADAQAVATEKGQKQQEYMQQALAKELEKYEPPLRDQLRTAYETPAEQRTDEHKKLLAEYPSVNISPGVLYQYLPDAAEDLKKYDQRIEEIRQKKPAEGFVRVLRETPGHAPLAKLFHRGDHAQPKEEVTPAAIAVATASEERVEFPADDPDVPTSGRRLALARWLTSPDNPLVARVVVNRIWMHHFGQGLVTTPGDFGKLGSQPTHPELLDWLAAEFIEGGWSLKRLHREILLSTAWRQSSLRDAAMNDIDPENRYYWRKSLQRLEAEVLRDRMLASAGRLDRTQFGPPLSIKEDDAGQVIVDGSQTRRSLYIRVRRTQPVAMLQSFDAPVMEINCECRPASTVATQSLMLLNGEFTLEQAGHLADRALAEAEALPAELLAALPALPALESGPWVSGYGRYDEGAGQVVDFQPLPFWTGSEWQGGPDRPDPSIGWVILNAAGGHPGRSFAAIRRWTAPVAGTVTVAGQLSHGSEHGDGVRGLIVSGSAGVLGDWSAHNGGAETSVGPLAVQPGEVIDFVADCRDHETSDSFHWPVTLTLTPVEGPPRMFASQPQFHGPLPDVSELPAQVHRAWRLAFCREPEPQELRLAVAFVSEQLTALQEEERGIASGRTLVGQALVNLCQMLLNANEFLYID